MEQIRPYKTIIGRLVKEGYLKEHHDSNDFVEALKKWREDNPILKPLHPSAVDPYREAECLICRDLEWLHPVINGRPDYSQLISCSCGKDLFIANSRRIALENSGIPTAPRMNDFEAFVLDDKTQGSSNAFKLASNLAMGKADFKLLLIYGGHGNGKSHLCYASALEAIKRGKKTRYINFIELCSKARSTIKKQDEDMEEVIGWYKKCEFLCLDEVRLETIDGWSARIIEDIVGYRYDRELETIITTNHPPEELPAPVKSRFKDSRIAQCVRNTAPDFRPRTKKANPNFVE